MDGCETFVPVLTCASCWNSKLPLKLFLFPEMFVSVFLLAVTSLRHRERIIEQPHLSEWCWVVSCTQSWRCEWDGIYVPQIQVLPMCTLHHSKLPGLLVYSIKSQLKYWAELGSPQFTKKCVSVRKRGDVTHSVESVDLLSDFLRWRSQHCRPLHLVSHIFQNEYPLI